MYVPKNQQGRLPKPKLKPLFEPKKIMWIRVQIKNYDNLRRKKRVQAREEPAVHQPMKI